MLSLPNRSTVDYWLNSEVTERDVAQMPFFRGFLIQRRSNIGNSRQWPRIVGENFEDKAVVGGPGLAAARKSRPG